MHTYTVTTRHQYSHCYFQTHEQIADNDLRLLFLDLVFSTSANDVFSVCSFYRIHYTDKYKQVLHTCRADQENHAIEHYSDTTTGRGWSLSVLIPKLTSRIFYGRLDDVARISMMSSDRARLQLLKSGKT